MGGREGGMDKGREGIGIEFHIYVEGVPHLGVTL